VCLSLVAPQSLANALSEAAFAAFPPMIRRCTLLDTKQLGANGQWKTTRSKVENSEQNSSLFETQSQRIFVVDNASFAI
jgi:hypothetical protein